ncbi:ribosomal maturation YjgA family protein [Aegicerativicinus sediminis]
MRISFNSNYLMLFLVILILELGLALWIQNGFLRVTFGDFLVVILVYAAARSIIHIKPIYMAIAVLIFAIGVETLQYFKLINLLGLENNMLARLVLGNTFSFQDIFAYILGVTVIYFIDLKTFEHEPF